MKKSVVYKITSPTGRFYIGKTVDFVNRMTSYKNLNNPQQLIVHSSILKYGWENHQVEILEEASPNILNDLEIKYIDEYRSYHYDNPLGMNLTRGGDGVTGRVDSVEVRTKRAQKLTGSKRSEATKKLMSDLKKGKVPVAATLPRSEKQLHHLKYGNIGRKKDQESIKKNLQTKLDNFIKQHGGVLQYDLDKNLIKEWQILPKYVAKANNIDDSGFSRVLKRGGGKCAGYFWTYKNNIK
jgi:group I intron endonuclease